MADVKLNSLKFPNLPDRYILDAGKVEYHEADTFEEDTVGKALQNKAEVDGSYESMTVGNAEQLVSNVRVNDKTPYLFRTAGGSVDIGDREYINGIVGGTVAWNQLAPSNYSKDADSLTAFAAGTIIVAGHKYFLSRKLSASEDVINAVFCRVNSVNQNSLYIDGTKTATIKQALFSGTSTGGTSTSEGNAWIYQGNNSNTVTVTDLNIIDLTQMFGSTIADYIYSLETATTGAGVAWFRKLFNKPYYAYNAGELKSVSGLVSHDMTGFNQWDEEWELGYLDAQGAEASSTNNIRSKFFDLCIGGVTYYIYNGTSTSIKFYEYDADKNYVDNWSCNAGTSRIVTTSGNTRYFKICTSAGVTTYNNDICINLAWDNSRNGEYEPYVKHSYPLDNSLTLRGIPKLDASNNLYYDGDTYESDGTVTRKFGKITIDGTENNTWYMNTQGDCQGVYTNASFLPNVNTTDRSQDMMCDRFVPSDVANTKRVGEAYVDTGWFNMLFAPNTFSTSAEVKTWLTTHNVTLVYELAEPTTETADPYQQTQVVNDFGTEEYVIDSNTFAVPVGSDTDYPVNLVAKLEMAPNSPDGSGDYIVRQTNGVNEYVPLVIEDALPTIPSTAGTYTLTVTVADGADPVLSWEA